MACSPAIMYHQQIAVFQHFNSSRCLDMKTKHASAVYDWVKGHVAPKLVSNAAGSLRPAHGKSVLQCIHDANIWIQLGGPAF